MNKKTVLWILIAILITALIWGAVSLLNINFLKGSAPGNADIPKSSETQSPENDVYPGVAIDEKTWQGEVLSVSEDSFTVRANSEEWVFLFNDESKRQFELLEIEAGNVAMVEFSEADGQKTATYIEKVISY